MKNKIDYKETAKVAAILVAICVLVTALLSGTYILTKEPIAKAAEAAEAASRIEVLPAEEYLPVDGYDNVYLARNGGRTAGCVIVTRSKGYGGVITVMTGIDLSGSVTGVTILDLSETPGVGMKTNDPDYLSQYVTASAEEDFAQEPSPSDAAASAEDADAQAAEEQPVEIVSDIPSEPSPVTDFFALTKDGGEINGITGATISSRAVNSAVNEALGIYNELVAGGLFADTETVSEEVPPPEAEEAPAEQPAP